MVSYYISKLAKVLNFLLLAAAHMVAQAADVTEYSVTLSVMNNSIVVCLPLAGQLDC